MWKVLMNLSPRVIAIAVLSTLVSCAVVGTSERPGAPKIDGLGNHTWKITTKSPEAQALFTQGVQLVYGFDHRDAARSFRAAFAADPTCAMCAWGLAYALGPNVNDNNPADRKESARYQERADKLANEVTPLERAVIRAANGRYVSSDKKDEKPNVPVATICSANKSKAAPEYDLAYAQRMQVVFKEFGTHPDVAALYADAELVTDAWNWWSSEGKPTAATEKAVNALEGVFKTHREHTGANHLLIHALEQSPKPERAMASADLLRTLAPGAPHLLHMPSHIYIKTGRFADATLANQNALVADDKRDALVKAQGFEASRSWRSHHLHFLQYAAMMDGRSDVALEAASRLASMGGKSTRSDTYSEYLRVLPRLNQARFEQWDALLSASTVLATRDGLEEGLSRYTRGLAHVARGNLPEAEQQLKELRRVAAQDKNRSETIFGDTKIVALLQVAVEALDGQLKIKLQQSEAGLDALKRSVKLEAALEADDPPLLGAHTRPMLARALLAAGRHAEAEAAAREDLKAIPNSGWSLAVLRDALTAQKKEAEAAEVAKRLGVVWGRADAELIKS
jgi:tetratricopeptide (TPR) repeat protein